MPAGGEASVTITFDHTKAAVDVYGGRLIARSGDIVVQTLVGAYKEPESYDLTVRFIDRDGNETQGGAGKATWVRLDTGKDAFGGMLDNSTVRLPAGGTPCSDLLPRRYLANICRPAQLWPSRQSTCARTQLSRWMPAR
ncbi:hypothetical protein, partial [Kibdelosporangium philippinense]|uniref:hypothetical protein n=1 Tax=Kibdelosporangium philippinense TaxID=211113 RepID=UPI003608E0AF